MRPGYAALTSVLTVILTVSSMVSGDIPDPGSPRYANNIMSDFVTPTVRPGETAVFEFNITNPYGNASYVMEDLSLTMGVYRYSTQEETRNVTEDFRNPPLIDGLGIEVTRQLEDLLEGQSARMRFEIHTKEKTPHGSYFSQSTYFIRFKMTFHFPGNATQVLLQSRGFFTDEQWDQMVSFEADESIVNTTYMRSLGVDGLLPDSSFGIKVPIPRWPLGLLIVGIGACSFMALYYFVMDNPGMYPKLEKRFYHLRGKLRELRSKLQDRRGK
ncbi:MAG: hypothetical protein QXU73_04890 [Thermoplasmata archaeon]